MPSKEKQEDIKVEARLTVFDSGNLAATVRRFDAAWRMAKDLANDGYLPVRIRLDGFVRKDVSRDEFVIRY